MPQKPLNQELLDEPYRFEFFQAVRLLEKLYPERQPIGRESLPYNEVVRVRSRMSLSFPASEVHEFKEVFDEQTDTRVLEMFVNFMGLTGPSGLLPPNYTEMLAERARYRDTAMWAFLDIFTHRAVSLFFRAWEKYRFPVGYERGNDDFTANLFDFAGLGTKGLKGRLALEDESLLPYSGLIAQKPHSSSALGNILGDYFGIAAEVLQFFGQWIELDEESITYTGTANSRLGVSAIAGTKVWEQQSKFRIKLGPLDFKQFISFFPNGSAHKPLESIVRFMIGAELDFDIQLVLAAEQVPSCILTTRAMRRPMLGWSSWLKTKPFKQDDEQVVLQMQ